MFFLPEDQTPDLWDILFNDDEEQNNEEDDVVKKLRDVIKPQY